MKTKYLFLLAIFFLNNVFAATQPSIIDSKINSILYDHYNKYRDQEYFSGIALSIYSPTPSNNAIHNYYIGTLSHNANSAPISEKTLFQIGSITKSFTAALLLQLENDKKLQLTDTLKTWFPNYDKWSAVTIKQLLNMTSGLPNYSDSPLWNTEEYNNLQREWTEQELINFVYPKPEFNPPLKQTYFYSNTAYILAGEIAEKVSQLSLKELYSTRLFNKAKLQHTFYLTLDHGSDLQLASTYNYNQYDNPWLVGTDVSTNNLSWAGAAGGILSTSEDVTKWVKALFIDHEILNDHQKAELMSIVSTSTGKPIPQTNKTAPRGFGLGVSQGYKEGIGRYWFYEGQTLGARAIYLYVPCTGIIVTAIFNSATNSENDHAHDLLVKLYQTLSVLSPKIRQCSTK